jgi:L-lactate dehydrogenase complex protein LldG
MSSRDKILAEVSKNQPDRLELPELVFPQSTGDDLLEKFTSVAIGVGSKIFAVTSLEEVKQMIRKLFPDTSRIISPVPDFYSVAETDGLENTAPHSFEDVDLSIIKAHFGVAENSAIWVTEEMLCQRVVPFISQHLAVILHKENILPSMHQAYEKIGNQEYGFGVFIAGPSKTADIEQSLVLGAHGPRSLMVFLME